MRRPVSEGATAEDKAMAAPERALPAAKEVTAGSF
jgi:hypothetical protein